MNSYSRSRAELEGRKIEANGQNQSRFLERGKFLVPTGIQNPDNSVHCLVLCRPRFENLKPIGMGNGKMSMTCGIGKKVAGT
jgi:hypothetical protein